MELDDDDQPKKLSTGKKIRIAIAVTLALLAGASLLYTRYGVTKQGLAGPCKYAYHCGPDAPRCMRAPEDPQGICTRQCDPPNDCAASIQCIDVELEERDERGMPLHGGICIPSSMLDGKKRRKPVDGGAQKDDAWLAAPAIAGQLEGEITLRTDSGSQQGQPRSYVLKGSLLKSAANPSGGPKRRAIVDTAGMRTFSVDDDMKTFSATVLAAPPSDTKVDKTGKNLTFQGKECEVWRIDDGKSVRDACIMQGSAFIEPSARSVPAWQRELAVRGAFPIDVVERDRKGNELSHLTVTRLDLHPVDAAEVSIPKSYKNLAAR
jgi:hypothetical protein